ncbi:MAG: family 10 glycosylhydrolase [Bacteroidetes bacterium]|nr:family 10 glycosylhydrolase [Bacteroidota bacterium]
MKNKSFLLLFIILIFAHFTFAQAKPEFRGVWISTVSNIDWPAKDEWNSEKQKADFIRLLDLHKSNGLNAVIVQIRPASDAFYPSPYEPWSQWLTGTQGKAPFPFYDPLKFMIDEAHKRGLEFHAWLNPYRAVFNTKTSSVSSDHITKQHPEWFLTYGDKKYFNPGNKDAQYYVVKVVQDIVSRYAVDGIHMDDYFYPYRIPGKEFPDQNTYLKSGSKLSKDDWRRSNVDSIILAVHNVIKKTNPKCQFGISPFGVWRNADKDPNGSNTRAGQTNYDDLYADILLWLKKDWIDYVAPQIYWEFEQRDAPFQTVLDWWSNHTYGKNCYIGIGLYKAGTIAPWKDKTQLPRQIEAVRKTPNVQGVVFFSSKNLENNANGWSDSLRTNYFKVPAKTPTMK